MRVLHVEAGRHLYGGALQVVFLLRGLKEHPGEHILACPEGSAIAEAARPHAAKVYEIPMKGDADVGLVRRLRKIICKEHIDLIHLHSRRGSDLWGGIAGRLEGIPVVLSRRVDNPEPRWLVALKYRLYDRVITISEGIRKVLLEEGVPPEKVVCVHSAVDTERYRPGCRDREWFRKEFGLAEDEKTVGMAAQFIPRKGHRTLIDAIPKILEEQPRTRFLLFGRGPTESAIRALADQNGVSNKVIFAGFRDDLEQILPCLNVLAHPAHMEGLGVALLQAAACGIPVVAGRAGGIPEIVQDGSTGYLVEPGDARALASNILHLLKGQSHSAELGHRARSYVTKHFSVQSMTHGNYLAYSSVAAR